MIQHRFQTQECHLDTSNISGWEPKNGANGKKLAMAEIVDIHGLRLIVENEEDCYKALQLWSEVPGKSKDYIKHQKCNGYQSLHTVVMGEGSVPLEVEIRTKYDNMGSLGRHVSMWANTKHALTTMMLLCLPARSFSILMIATFL